jgi:transposase
LWIARTGSPWRDLPRAFGHWNSVYTRFRYWVKADVWKRLFEAVSDDVEADHFRSEKSNLHACSRSPLYGPCRTTRQNHKLARVHTVRTSVMSNRLEERLDRRDFMIASIATAGASAALAVTAGANAEGAATISAEMASGTVYTGDIIQRKKVVSALDVKDLEPGKKHLLYFQGVQMPTGQHWYVSVTVAKGPILGRPVRPRDFQRQ